jgi:DNA polymerase-3 subunit epsilon
MFKILLGNEARRKRLLKKLPKGPLYDFLSIPFPSEETCFEDLPILSVDFETTGLNAVTDKLLSVGFVTIRQQQIKLGSCYHQVINTHDNLDPDNVIVHQITDQQKSQGLPLQTVIEALLKAMAGKVMLVHFAKIEKQFLKRACLELYGVSPPFLVIDTLAIEKRKLDKKDIAYDPQTLRLPALRRKYNLPNFHAHNALKDAIATAELLLAQQQNKSTKLKDLL